MKPPVWMNTLKTISVILILDILLATIAVAQSIDDTQHDTEVYPGVYTLDAARALMNSGKTALSLWYCINLYADHRDSVVQFVCDHRETSEDLAGDVRASFATYNLLDPAKSRIDAGTLGVDADSLARVALMVDDLCTDIERHLIESCFVNDLLLHYSQEYQEVVTPSSGDNLSNRVQWMIDSPYRPDDVTLSIHYLRANEGKAVRGYEGKLVDRINVVVLSNKSSEICDSVWNSILRMMEVGPPLSDNLPQGVHSPPEVLVKGTETIVLVKFRCVNFLTGDGIMEDNAFWEQAESIAAMIKGFRPSQALACGCEGPLRYLDYGSSSIE